MWAIHRGRKMNSEDTRVHVPTKWDEMFQDTVLRVEAIVQCTIRAISGQDCAV